MKEFIDSADMEKITAMETERYIEERGARGSEEKYLDVLKKVPHVPAREGDS